MHASASAPICVAMALTAEPGGGNAELLHPTIISDVL
jgi:hypothetical protein